MTMESFLLPEDPAMDAMNDFQQMIAILQFNYQ